MRPNSNPTNTDFANQAEVIVAKTDLIVTRVRIVPVAVLTGVNSTGKNHKRLPKERPITVPGHARVMLVDVHPKPLRFLAYARFK